MRCSIVAQKKTRLPRWQTVAAGLGLAVARAGHAFAQNTTLGGMAAASSVDLIETSSWISLIFFFLGGIFLIGAIYHAVMHRNGRSTVPLAGVAFMLLLSGASLGAGAILSASARSVTGAAPGITQATAVQPFQVQ